ncbi:MAG: hypothetical protein ACI9KE_002151 [Polyangiales bacterium]|jgi:hypothetical protein
MSEEESEYTKPWIRHAILWAGFAVLVVVGVWTVVLPSVEDSPVDPEVTNAEAESGEAVSDDDENPNDSNN